METEAVVGASKHWSATLLRKVGQTKDWNVVQVHILNSSWDETKLQNAKVYAGEVECEPMPAITKASEWYRVKCDTAEKTGKGPAAKTVKVVGNSGEPLHFCGIKVYGNQS